MRNSLYKEKNFKLTSIGRIPKDWYSTKLDDITDINVELKDPSKESPNELFSYIDISSIKNEIGIIHDVKEILGKDAPLRARRVVRQNDIIMSTVRPYLKAFAIIPEKYDGQICSTGFAVFTSKDKILPKFLLYSLLSDIVINQCNKMMIGGQYPALNVSQVAMIKIPLPPISEQQKITEILSIVDENIQKIDEIVVKAEFIKEGLMHKLFTKGIGHKKLKETIIGRIPKDWEVKKIKEVCHKPQYGYTQSASMKPIGPKFLRITDIQEGQVDWGKVPFCKCTKKNVEKYLLEPGDILFARTGATTGKTYLIKDPPKAIFASYLIRLKPKEVVDPSFLSQVFNSTIYWRQVRRNRRGAAQGGLNATVLSNIKIPFPFIKEQKKIAIILSTVDKKIEREKEVKRGLEKIKQGLMDKLLTGKVRIKVN